MKAILILFVLGFSVWQIIKPHRVNIQVTGAGVSLKQGKWLTETSPESPLEVNGAFLAIGAQQVEAPFAEGSLSLIPMEEVPALEKKFGNFLHCENDNQFVGMNKVQDLFIVPNSKVVRQAFKDLLALFKKESRPVVRIATDKLKIRRLASGQTEVNLSGISHVHLLKDLRIERPDYRTPGFEKDRGRRVFRALMFQ